MGLNDVRVINLRERFDLAEERLRLQPISGIVVGAFAPTAADAPPEAYRAVFAFLALATAAAILIYARAPDVKPRQT